MQASLTHSSKGSRSRQLVFCNWLPLINRLDTAGFSDFLVSYCICSWFCQLVFLVLSSLFASNICHVFNVSALVSSAYLIIESTVALYIFDFVCISIYFDTIKTIMETLVISAEIAKYEFLANRWMHKRDNESQNNNMSWKPIYSTWFRNIFINFVEGFTTTKNEKKISPHTQFHDLQVHSISIF